MPELSFTQQMLPAVELEMQHVLDLSQGIIWMNST